MIHPFAPQTMEKVRQSLNLPEHIFSLSELGTGISAGPIKSFKFYWGQPTVAILGLDDVLEARWCVAAFCGKNGSAWVS